MLWLLARRPVLVRTLLLVLILQLELAAHAFCPFPDGGRLRCSKGWETFGEPTSASSRGMIRHVPGRQLPILRHGAAYATVAADTVGSAALGESGMWLGRRLAAFGGLFVCSALLHAAEVAITTLYPWKVKEFAEEEGPRSPFAMLDADITRALTAILVATTCANVCSTAIFTSVAGSLCDGSPQHLAYATASLTAMTLFFGELLPKAMGVNNAERVARLLAPIVNALTLVLGPIGSLFSKASKRFLKQVFGVRFAGVATAVSEEELRLIVGGATKSGGIESLEGTMIEGVLDLQDTRVSEIMRPRVEVKALDQDDSMLSLLRLVNATGHSRIPVYEDEIDNIVGVVNAKKLLSFVKAGDRSHSENKPPLLLDQAAVRDCCEPTYFVPETMPAWKVLEEMRRRRIHMAIVVDEFGGTAGMVTLEDILELVVGEIYDEDDNDALNKTEDIVRRGDDGSYAVRGTASIDELVATLHIEGVDVDAIPDVTTAAGFVCYHAGEIPAAGDHVFVANYDFEILDADEREHDSVLDVNSGLTKGSTGRVYSLLVRPLETQTPLLPTHHTEQSKRLS